MISAVAYATMSRMANATGQYAQTTAGRKEARMNRRRVVAVVVGIASAVTIAAGRQSPSSDRPIVVQGAMTIEVQ